MPARAPTRDTSIATYRAKRDFGRTPEPAPGRRAQGSALSFVIQKHDATRLHWDFRLEHGGVLWSWAVPKGPSLDPADKRLAVRVEDHPLAYGAFHGTIPAGNYGAGTVEIWDNGFWEPQGDPVADLKRGEIKFVMRGKRLQGGFVLVRLRGKAKDRAENWLLIKEHDQHEQAGADAAVLEKRPAPKPKQVPETAKPAAVKRAESAAAPKAIPVPKDVVITKPARAAAKPRKGTAPAPGAVQSEMPTDQKPQLAKLAEAAPEGEGWISEVKFDGYRLIAFKDGKHVRLLTRNGHDWTKKLAGIARAVAALKQDHVVLDGELVALRKDGHSSFADLQSTLSGDAKKPLHYYLFDLLYHEGWDLRPCALSDRKTVLQTLCDWRGTLRYSDHLSGQSARVRREACAMGLEGIICKRAAAPYRGARGADWLKVKCQGRDEFVVIGWTPPAGTRQGLGALHLGFYDADGHLHYVGGVGSGFETRELTALSRRLDTLASTPPQGLLLAGDKPESTIRWVRPDLVVEVQYGAWTGMGRLRHAVYLGLRADKAAEDVVRDIPDPDAERHAWSARGTIGGIVHAPKPARGNRMVADVAITHPDRALWPGITKADLAAYWQAVAPHALPGIAHRPLSLLRCPDGIAGQHFFQKHANKGMPPQIRTGTAPEGPYLAIDDEAGLIACAQLAAIELHTWGATEADPAHPDRIVFDLDPGEGVRFADVMQAAKDVRDRLKALKLESFVRTSGGKGLHVVAPITPKEGWDVVRDFCHRFAQEMEQDDPARFIATVSKAKRRGRILVDWLRNGGGATAVASYVPRARDGAGVATPIAWRELTAKFDPQAFNLHSVPARLRKLKKDPWDGFDDLRQSLPKQKPKTGTKGR